MRPLLGVVAGLFGLGMVVAGPPAAAQDAGRRPNIVLIVGDDQSWTDFGFMGHPVIRTPNLDRLSREGLTFRRGYVPTSLCCPSLATILTGRYPHETKVTGNEPPLPKGLSGQGRYRDPAFLAQVNRLNGFIGEFPRLPSELAKAGYLSLQTGKWWAGHHATGGFTHGMSHGDQSRGGRHGDEGLAIGRQTMQPIYDFIREAREAQKPFLVWYAPMLPHDPHTPPERLLAHYRDRTPSIHIARYWAMCEWFDETVGALLDHLDEQGLARETIVAFVTDNGRVPAPDSAGALPSKNTPYDAGLRTPILLRWPGHIAPRQDETPVSSIDLFPTLLKLADVEPPTGLPGLDLRDERAIRARPAVFGATFLHNANDLEHPAENLTARWCVSGEWKLILPNAANLPTPFRPGEATAAPQLFRISSDPSEARDLAAAEPGRVSELRALIDAWWTPSPGLSTAPGDPRP